MGDVFSPSAAFNALWLQVIARQIPDPIGKKLAMKHYIASVHSPEDAANCVTAWENYCASERVKSGFVQNGSTWFNNWPDWLNKTKVAPLFDASNPVFGACVCGHDQDFHYEFSGPCQIKKDRNNATACKCMKFEAAA